MNLKTSSACLLMILLASCTNPAENVIPTPLASLTPTATSAPSQTPTPKPTETKTSTPTPEVELHGLIEKFNDIPEYSRAQETLHIQKAYDTRTLYQEPGDIWHIQISPLVFNDLVKGEGVRIDCNVNKSCLIRDTYKVNVGNEANPLIVHKLLMEYFVTFEDGTQGSVIVPIIFDQEWSEPGTTPYEETWYRLEVLAKDQASSTGVIENINFITSVKPNSRQPTNPAIKKLWDIIITDPTTSALLEKVHRLAEEGKFLTQDEINLLIDAILW